MTSFHRIPGAASIAHVLTSAVGPRIYLAPPDDIATLFRQHHTEVKTALDNHGREIAGLEEKQTEGFAGLGSRLTDLEQKVSLRRPSGAVEEQTTGHQVVNNPEFKTAMALGDRFRGRVRVEVKAITTAKVGGAIAPDIQPIAIAPRRRLTIRSLLAQGRTTSNTIWYPVHTRTNNAAATVAENPSAPKPESDFDITPTSTNVRTIAHWVQASAQILSDMPQLAGLIDSELRYGLQDQEERQLLFGDGTGTNLTGLMTLATPYAQPAGMGTTGETMLDRILFAITQAELALLPATGIVLNTVDYRQMLIKKDSTGRYLSAGPFGGENTRSLWDLPIVFTPVMPQNQFLLGAFADGAQIFDREDANVLVSNEDRDNFVKNLVTILAEQRLALAIKRPAAFIKGNFTGAA